MSAAEILEASLFRALAIYRGIVLAFAVGINATRSLEFAVPWLAWSVVAAIVVWTLLITWAYDRYPTRKPPWLVADLLVTLLALLSTRVAQSEEQLDASDPTIPTFWVSAALLAWALHWRWQGGLSAAVVLTAADTWVRRDLDTTAVGNIFLLFLAAGVVGYCAGLLYDAAEARSQAERLAAAAEERERLARDIHDGVLQVLALVQRRGAEIGGPAAELGRLAGEQEVALRQLVQRPPGVPVESAGGESGEDVVDLGAALNAVAGARVTVSTPGEPVPVEATVAREVVSAVRAALDNTVRHAGPKASSWVLLEEAGSEVVVSVRDDGPGIADGRLEAADAEGRMGVRTSIRSRIRDLGGTAELTTRPGQGVEWELRVPRLLG